MLGVGSNSLQIFSKTFSVVRTIGYEKVHFGANKELKILKAVPKFGVGNIRGRSCLKYLNESWFLPPPGGAQTGTIVVSTIYLKNSFWRS